MGTNSDMERREVARRLRKTIGLTEFAEALGFNWTDESDWGWKDVSNLVADLIEPSEPEVKYVAEVKVDGWRIEELAHDAAVELTGIDREALLELADEMERMPQCELCPAEIVDCSAHPDGCPDALLDYYARRIREALGVQDA